MNLLDKLKSYFTPGVLAAYNISRLNMKIYILNFKDEYLCNHFSLILASDLSPLYPQRV